MCSTENAPLFVRLIKAVRVFDIVVAAGEMFLSLDCAEFCDDCLCTLSADLADLQLFYIVFFFTMFLTECTLCSYIKLTKFYC